MRFTATAAAAMVGVAAASYAPEGHYEAPSNSTKPEDVYTTEVVTAYTTFCPVCISSSVPGFEGTFADRLQTGRH